MDAELVKQLRSGEFGCDMKEANMLADTIERLSARIAALEADNKALLSGQPTEVNGEMWQLVPAEPSSAMLRPSDDWCDRTVNRAIYAAMLTASAQEMKKP